MRAQRDSFSLGCAGLATAGTPALTASKITNITHYVIGGRAFVKAATDNIAFVARTGFTLPVLAASQGLVIFAMLDAAGNLVYQTRRASDVAYVSTTGLGYVPGAAEWAPDDATYACIGAIKVETNASGAFTFGTTALNAANVTVTYYNVALDYGQAITF